MPELLPCAPGSPEWLAARRQGVTATDIVTILGLSAWNSPYSLFWQKMGQVPETPDNDRFRLGRELEGYTVTRWLEEHPGAIVLEGALFRSTDRPWQMATLDRQLWTGPGVLGLADSLLEVKTWADADKPAWHDGPPAAVRAQVLWQMDVMDVGVGHVGVVFLPSGEFRSYVIDHGHPKIRMQVGCTVCEDQILMRRAGEEFMQRLRLELPAPDPDASAATLAAVKARFAKAPDKQAEIDPVTWADWLLFKGAKDAAEESCRAAESKLREQAGEASVYTVDGQPVARRMVVKQHVREHDRTQDYLKRIVREAVTDEHTNGTWEQQ